MVALWRETLLAKKVLEGNTKGYKNHPQLIRFRDSFIPLAAINFYLSFVLEEASVRGYTFSREMISWEECQGNCPALKVTSGQMEFERKHLLEKLSLRDKGKYKELKTLQTWDAHPLFEIVEGKVEGWEVLKK